MYGIAGEVRFDGRPADLAAVTKMADAKADRDPDDAGLWHAGPVAFGHRGLEIIDLGEAAAQPMTDDRLGLTVVFNGCIYNYRELRRELEQAGQQFRSTTDSEVVMRAYAKWGECFVDHLIGMFAIAIADRYLARVVLVRDRLGIKPLYVSETSHRLRFASTVPALLAGRDVDTALDPEALHQYISWHSIVPAPRTVLRGVRKLPPATIRIVTLDGRCWDRVYWRPVFERGEYADWSPQQWRDALLAALRTAVRRRMVADIPVGVLLSGGVDSSLIVALLATEGVPDLETFSIGFDGHGQRDGDEFHWSDAVARQYRTDHHRLHVPSTEISSAIERTVHAMTEPQATHDVVAFHLLSEQVKNHVTVVQSGQGADEVFAGYDYYQPLAGVPREDAACVFTERFADLPPNEVMTALSPRYRPDHDVSTKLIEQQCVRSGAETALDAILRLELTHLVPDDPARRVDNMTMAFGVEARVPFLDHELVELAAACPPELKLAQGGKGVLKDIARPLLPNGLVDRPKSYFPVPVITQLGTELMPLITDTLRSPAAKQRQLVQPEYLDRLLNAVGRGHAGNTERELWQLTVLEMWLQTHHID